MFVAKPATELHWQFPWAIPKYTIHKIVKWNWFIVVNSCLRRICSVSLSYNTCHTRIRQHADHSEYRPCRLRTFLSYTCLPLHLWLAYICSKYKIVFNMSESLLFITKEVTGSQHRKFFNTIIFTHILNQRLNPRFNTALLRPVDK